MLAVEQHSRWRGPWPHRWILVSSARGRFPTHSGRAGLLAIAIASALVCGVTFAMWASDDSGKFTAKLAASIATGAAAVLLGVVCGYVFAMAARSERRAVGVEEPRNLTLREGMRQQWPYAKSAKDAEEP